MLVSSEFFREIQISDAGLRDLLATGPTPSRFLNFLAAISLRTRTDAYTWDFISIEQDDEQNNSQSD